MDDPTNFDIPSSLQTVYLLAKEKIEAGCKIEYILQQQRFLEEEEELKRDIARARLKLYPLSYFVMTINMNGASLGEGTAANRRLLLTIILRTFPCSLIMSQEQNNTIVRHILKRSDLEAKQNENEAAVFWDGNDFEGTDEGLKSSDTRIIRIRAEVASRFNEVDMSEVLSRIKMVKLTSKTENENPSFLAVSWHGPHRKHSDSKKHKLFKGLQEFVKKVCEKEGNIPFIIGGDFNFDTLGEVPMLGGAILSSYTPSPRAERSSRNYIQNKDNFLSYGIRVTFVRPLDFTSRTEPTQAAGDLSREEQNEVEDIHVDPSRGGVDDLLDHDPIVGVLKLGSDPLVQNLAENFEALSTANV